MVTPILNFKSLQNVMQENSSHHNSTRNSFPVKEPIPIQILTTVEGPLQKKIMLRNDISIRNSCLEPNRSINIIKITNNKILDSPCAGDESNDKLSDINLVSNMSGSRRSRVERRKSKGKITIFPSDPSPN